MWIFSFTTAKENIHSPVINKQHGGNDIDDVMYLYIVRITDVLRVIVVVNRTNLHQRMIELSWLVFVHKLLKSIRERLNDKSVRVDGFVFGEEIR